MIGVKIYLIIFCSVLVLGLGIGLAETLKLGKRSVAKMVAAAEQKEQLVNKLLKDSEQSHPWLAKEIADIQYLVDLKVADELKSKSHPALKAAEEVKKIAAEKRALMQQNKALSYQLQFLSDMYPWLDAYKEVAVQDAVDFNSTDEEYDKVNKWLSPKEYKELPTAKRNQLALDRWKKRKKTEWEAGRDYERYIGWRYESQGFKVDFVGALRGKEDRGIDLVASKGKTIEIVQCKRYSAIKEKWVRENTVAQIYGVTALYNMENPGKNATPVIYTSSALSDEAKHFAEYLSIRVNENVPLEDYPIIKCNVNKKGEKIYHLPFDQQYDKVRIDGKNGSHYEKTVDKAEQAGFRRAKKWIPDGGVT